ncbi:polymorphic toxin-type HINT domain-containing protein [Micromonospora sp. NPDC047074]|uniref:polymorphic toxin-type HINT domain-containing protein n=1 Tax=Micromonospora sp. NPDC047074 TaxID=3154339 RepID=UPI0034080002
MGSLLRLLLTITPTGSGPCRQAAVDDLRPVLEHLELALHGAGDLAEVGGGQVADIALDERPMPSCGLRSGAYVGNWNTVSQSALAPEIGKTESRKVVALIVGDGYKNLVEVTVDTDGTTGDDSGSVIATDGHPFWVSDLGEWIDAKDLKPGQWLRTSAGTYVQVEAVRPSSTTAKLARMPPVSRATASTLGRLAARQALDPA